MLRTLIILSALAVCACAPRKLMLFDTFVPGHDKVARAAVKPVGSTGGKNPTMLTNYSIQICDVNAGVATNCRTNLILENLTNYQLIRTPGGR